MRTWRMLLTALAVTTLALAAPQGCESDGADTGADIGDEIGDDVGDDVGDSVGDDASAGAGTGGSDDLEGETCTATFRWLQKDAYAEVAGRSTPLWPPHTTTTLQVICVDDATGDETLVADTFMANHGTEPGSVDLNGDEILVEAHAEAVEGSRDELLALVDAYEGCECFPGTDFLSMDALEDEAVQLVVEKLLTYVSMHLDCGGDPPVEEVIGALQAGDIEYVISVVPACTWADGHDWSTGLSDAALVLLDDVITTLDAYHVCNNDALLQATLWAEYLDSGEVGTCNSGSAICAGPMWFYEPTSTPADPGECEIEVDELADPDTDVSWACDLPSPCEPVDYDESGSETGGDEPPHFVDDDAVACVVEAFKAGQPAEVVLTTSTYISDWTETIFILDDTYAVAHGSWWYDSPGGSWRKERQLLQPAAYFDGCLAAADAEATWDCLEDWSAGCGEQDVSCE